MTASQAQTVAPDVTDAALARRNLGFPWIAVALICGLPLVLRLHLLSIPVPINPDEAQWTVTARSAFDDPILWRSIDMQTSGPLNAVVIAWPKLFGVTPSIFTSKVTAFVLESLMLLGMTTFIRRGEALSLGAAAILTLATWITVTPVFDFLGYCGELLPLTLIVWFCVVFAGLGRGSPAGPRLALCGLIAGALPFAKMQSAPFAVLFVAACLFWLWIEIRAGRAGLREAAWWLAGSAIPALVLVAPLFLVGEQDAFLKGYLGLASGYGGARNAAFIFFTGAFVPLMAVIWAVVSSRWRDVAARGQGRLDLFLISLGLWPAVFLAIWLPGRDFRHYHWFALVGLPLAVLLAQYSLPVVPPRLPAAVRILVVLLIVGIGAKGPVSAARAQWLGLYEEGAMDRAFPPPGPHPRALFAWTGAGENDTMFLWGWEPELTAFSGMRSASRAAIAEYLIRPNNARDYFRARLLGELQKTNPAIILDTVKEGYFFANDADFKPGEDGLSSFPALDKIVESNYELVAGGARCASVYLRKDKAAALRAAEAPMMSTVPALIDGPATERCGDWWAPASSDATAEFTLLTPSPLKELWILSSRGGSTRGVEAIARNRGTTKAKIRFISESGAQSEVTAQLLSYPNWTVIPAPSIGPIARVEIESLEFVGKGPALAGVRAYKQAW